MARRASARAGWIWVIGLTAVIYASLPVMPSVWRALDQRIPLLLRSSGWLFSLSAAAALWAAVLIGRAERRPLPLVVLAALTGLFAWGLAATPYPAERFHFLEYGLLGALTLRSSLHTYEDRWTAAFGLAALVVFAVGGLDEAIQYALPNRFFDWHDIWYNILGGLLGFGAFLAVSPPVRRP